MNWKQTAKDHMRKAEILEVIEIMEANGVVVGSLKDAYLRLEEEAQHPFPPGRYARFIADQEAILRVLMQLINNAN